MGHLISTLLPCFLITGAAANPLIHHQTGYHITPTFKEVQLMSRMRPTLMSKAMPPGGIPTVEITEDIAHLWSQQARLHTSELQNRVHAFLAATDQMLDSLTPDNTTEQINNPGNYLAVEKHYNSLKQIILMQTSLGNLQMAAMADLLQYANQVKRAARHL